MAAHHLVQRTAVRMLYDEELARAVRERPDELLAAAGLGERERRALLAIDPRAFRTDPLRRRRTLRALAGELKASTTLALAGSRSLAFVEGFFASREFHEAVAERRGLVFAYGHFLERAAIEGRVGGEHGRALATIARLELALASARRAHRARGGRPATSADLAADRPLGLAPGVAIASYPGETIAVLNEVERWLFEIGLMPAVALADDAPRLVLPPLGEAPAVHLLVLPAERPAAERAPSGESPRVEPSLLEPSLIEIDGELARLLAALPARASALRRSLDLPPGRSDELLAGCANDEILVVNSDERLVVEREDGR